MTASVVVAEIVKTRPISCRAMDRGLALEVERASAKARDARELAAYYAPGVEAWYADLAKSRGGVVLIPSNHDHNFRLLAFLDRFRPPAGSFHHLDVGCGAGLYAVNVLLRHPQARVTGIDISKRNLEAARALARKMGVSDRLTLVGADANLLPFRGDIDTVLCSEIVEHLPDPRGLLKRIADLTGPASRLYVSVPHIDRKNEAGDIIYVRYDEKGRKVGESAQASALEGVGRLEAYYHHLYTEEGITALLRGVGFEVEETTGANLRFPPRYPWISFGLKTLFRSAKLDASLNGLTRRRFAGNLLVVAKRHRD